MPRMGKAYQGLYISRVVVDTGLEKDNRDEEMLKISSLTGRYLQSDAGCERTEVFVAERYI